MTSRISSAAAALSLLIALPVFAASPRAVQLLPDAGPTFASEAAATTSATEPVPFKRHSNFSAGPGGPLLILNESLIGGIAGGILGAPYGRQQAFGGAIIGGMLLGGVGAVYQYYVPVGQNTALLSTIAAGTGLLAGAGIATYGAVQDPTGLSFLLLGASQVGALAGYAAGFGVPDISMGDFGLTVMTAGYATAFSLLTLQAFAMTGQVVDYRPLLFTPAAGMLLGGFFASMFEISPARVLKMTGLPMLTGLALYYVGWAVAGNGPIVPAVAAVGMAVTLGLTAVFTSEPAQAAVASNGHDILPTVVLARTHDGKSVAAGPGIVGVF